MPSIISFRAKSNDIEAEVEERTKNNRRKRARKSASKLSIDVHMMMSGMDVYGSEIEYDFMLIISPKDITFAQTLDILDFQ